MFSVDILCYQFRQAYGSKSNFVRIISKFPLPRYRPEFDPRMLMRHKVSLSPGTRRVLELSLNTLRLKSGQDDWVSEEDIPRTIKGKNGSLKAVLLVLRDVKNSL